MAQLAEATDSVISAVLFGALAGSKALPMQRMAFEAAIHRGGVGVKESIAAFNAGFAAAEGAPQLVQVPAQTEASSRLRWRRCWPRPDAYADPARMYVHAGIERLADYQDIDYAREYLANGSSRSPRSTGATAAARASSSPRPRASLRSAWPTRTRCASPS